MPDLRRSLVAAVAACAAMMPGCKHGPKTFETRAQIERVDVVRSDERGPVSMDVAFRWTECPGRQFQSLRGGRAFSNCFKGKKPGEHIAVRVVWEWDDHGHYDWHPTQLAGCELLPVDDDDSSFALVRECEPVRVHGAEVGFRCNLASDGDLVKQCPWFRR